MTVARRENARFLTLDAMRGVAAMAVLIHHFPDQTISGLLPGAYLAVDMFFVLSGFVLSHAYGWDLAGKMGAPRFMLKRLVRLYPVYILGTAAVALGYMLMWIPAGPSGRARMLASMAGALCLLPIPARFAYNIGVAFPLNPPAWSLFWELAANFLFALVNWTVRRLVTIVAAGAVLLALAFYIYGRGDAGSNWDNFPGGGCRVVYSFFIGVLLYRFQPKWTWSLPSPLLLLILPLSFMLPPLWDVPMALIFFPLLVFFGSMREPGPGLTRLFNLLGDISYPVYALHFAVLVAMTFAYKQSTGQELVTAGISGTLAGMAISTIIAYFAATRFDPAARKWLAQALDWLSKTRAARSLQRSQPSQ